MKKIIYLFLLFSVISANAQTLSDVKESSTSESPQVTHEKQVSSTLREISNLKLQLEKKKLQMEINKLEEASKPSSSSTGAVNPPTQMPVYSPFNINNMIGAENKSAAKNVKVLMIYGPTDDLMAKISVGTQGGYVVRKGDIMPDGKTVIKVNKNFIEVAEDIKNPVDIERVFVFTQYNNTNNSALPDGGNKSSTSIAPTALPSTNPGIPNPSKITNMLSPIPNNK